MLVSPLQLAALLEDLGIDSVAPQQTLFDADLGQAPNRNLELDIGQRVISDLVWTSCQPNVRLSDAGSLVHSLGHRQRLFSELAGGLCVALHETELGQAHQNMAATDLEIGLFGQLERTIQMLVRCRAVPLGQQDQAEV